jgi:hypothetical protein
MKRYHRIPNFPSFSKRYTLCGNVRAQPDFYKRKAGLRNQVVGMSRTGMITVGMGDEGSLDLPAWIDIKISRRAIKSFMADDQRFFHCPLLPLKKTDMVSSLS